MFSRQAIPRSRYLIRQFTFKSSSQKTFNRVQTAKSLSPKRPRGNIHEPQVSNAVSARILYTFGVVVTGITYWH
ncbi:13365_t:CDS:2, partial [Acaulospora morrowiae]